jgi:hypothetical protein
MGIDVSKIWDLEPTQFDKDCVEVGKQADLVVWDAKTAD